MEMITQLTPEQEAQIEVYKDKWMAIGLSTEPLDFERAKRGAIKAYELAGFKPPTEFLHFRSPVEAATETAKLMLPGEPTDSKKFKDKVSECFNGQVYGSHDAFWLGFYQFFGDVCGIEECNKLEGLYEIAQSCGWWAPYENVVVFQDRPKSILFDDEGRLHGENGPAIEYRDGWCLYAWHGVRIPKEWIEKRKTLDPKIALTWENIEQRRCAAEIIGWDRVLKELNSKTIDQDENPQIGELLEVTLPDVGREKFLRVVCGTGRTFALPVPQEMTTARQANAWTYSLDPDEYNPEVRT